MTDGGRSRAPRQADTERFAFTERGPWEVDPDRMPWRREVPALRDRARAEVPLLTRPPRLPPGPRAVTVLGRLGLALGLWAVRERRTGGTTSRAGLSRRLRRAAERLGPTYIKLGQIISSGEGLFPPELVEEFKLCRDRVPAEPFETVMRVVTEDLGRPLIDTFATFEPEPIAAASIAQVHAATLRTGEPVVVKVQRPAVARQVRADLRVMSWLSQYLVGRIPVAALANPPALVELFAETIVEELDFRLEAENMLDVARMLVECGQRGWVIPRPHPELVTRRVLVMERLDGYAFDDVAGMRAAGVNTHDVVRTGMIAFMEGAMLHGIFHGDLHGGNLFILPDGRTALLDFGITGRLTEDRRHAFLRLLLAAAANDLRSQLAALRDLGALPPDADLDDVIRRLGLDRPPVDPTTLSADELVREIQRTIKALLGIGARFPKELMLFVKNLMFLDAAIANLAPDLDLFSEIATISAHFAERHGERIAADVGIDPRSIDIDIDGVKAGLGLDPSTSRLTYRDIQERRRTIRERLRERRAR